MGWSRISNIWGYLGRIKRDVKIGTLFASAIFVSLTILPFFFYYLLLFVEILVTFEISISYVHLLYLLIYYVVLRYMRVDKILIYLSLPLIFIISFYRAYFDHIKGILDLSPLLSPFSVTIGDIFTFIGYLNLDNQFIEQALNIFGEKEVIIASVILVISYIYLLKYLEKSAISVYQFEKGDSKLNEFTISAVNLYHTFNIFIFFTLFSYLIFAYNNINQMIEIALISSLLCITHLLFKNIIGTHKKINLDYDYITEINERNPIAIVIKNLKDESKSLKARADEAAYTVLPKITRYIELIPFYPNFPRWVVIAIPIAAFTLPFISYALSFNALSILYIELTLLGWYSLMCVSLSIPTNKADIVMANGDHVKGVYIVEDVSDAYIIVIDQRSKLMKIMKSSIVSIVSPSPHEELKSGSPGSQPESVSSAEAISNPDIALDRENNVANSKG